MLDIDVANERILKEYIDGPTIYDLVKNDAMKDLYLVQMREMAKVVYDAGLNIDYFPTNFIVQDEKIFYIDYECNNYMDEWNFENWGLSTGLRQRNLLIIWSSISYVTQDFVQSKSLIILKTC